jgi:CubicO group peptidase (beta-lactamase class C family)
MKKLLMFLCLAVGLLPAALSQQPRIPVTPAAQVFAAWLSAFNSADRLEVERFHRTHGQGEARNVDRDLAMRERTGGFELQAIETDSPTTFIALLKERSSGRFGRIQMDVEAGAPHRLSGMQLQPAAGPPTPGAAEAPATHGTESQAVTAAREFLERESAAGRFAGAALVARNGKILFEQAYGLADRSRDIPNSLATRFRIGSMNKMFTAVAILQLVETGKLRLDDTLDKFLPDYPNKALAASVTIDHLLTHRGGTGDFFGPEYFSRKDRIRTLDDYIALVGARAPAFEPGARFEYSNFGYILLGAVVERVTGASYYEYVRKNIYDRAGMAASGAEPEERIADSVSVGYTHARGEPGWHPNTGELPWRGTSAGGGYSTVRDLLAFAEALRTGRLLGAEFSGRMMKGYALRNRLGDGGHGFVGHNGGSPGMNGDLRFYPQSGYVVVVLANLDPPAADAAADFIDARLPASGS